jgi:predicted cobalt transporter CbtA
MSVPNKYAPETNVLPPRCPHCAADLETVRTYQWTTQVAIGMGVLLCMYCPNAECRKILGTQILVVPHAQESSHIVGPH